MAPMIFYDVKIPYWKNRRWHIQALPILFRIHRDTEQWKIRQVNGAPLCPIGHIEESY